MKSLLGVKCFALPTDTFYQLLLGCGFGVLFCVQWILLAGCRRPLCVRIYRVVSVWLYQGRIVFRRLEYDPLLGICFESRLALG